MSVRLATLLLVLLLLASVLFFLLCVSLYRYMCRGALKLFECVRAYRTIAFVLFAFCSSTNHRLSAMLYKKEKLLVLYVLRVFAEWRMCKGLLLLLLLLFPLLLLLPLTQQNLLKYLCEMNGNRFGVCSSSFSILCFFGMLFILSRFSRGVLTLCSI